MIVLRIAALLFSVILIFTSIVGCSKGNLPVDPGIDPVNPFYDLPDSKANSRCMIGVWYACIDPEKREFTIESTDRIGSYHVDLTSIAPHVLSIEGYHFGPPFLADIKLSHPYPGSGIDGFDPRVIAVLPAVSGVTMNYPVHDVFANNAVLTNRDGYTKLWDKTVQPGTANPFIAYFKSQPNRVWSSTGVISETKRWEMDISGFGGSLSFYLVVDVSTNHPAPPQPGMDNAPEPAQIIAEVSYGLTPTGGNASIDVALLDWQGSGGIGGVYVESPDLFSGIVNLVFSNPGPGPNEYTYNGLITNQHHALPGSHSILIGAYDLATGIYAYNEFEAIVAGQPVPELIDVTPINLNLSPWKVSVDGDTAILLTEYQGMYICDVSDRSNPTLIKIIKDFDTYYDVWASDGYAYVGCSNGFNVYDIDPPQSSVLVRTVTDALGPHVHIDNNYAYIGLGHLFHIIDISVPENAFNVCDVNCPIMNPITDIYVDNGYAYLGLYQDNTPFGPTGHLHIVDVDPPQDAQALSTTATLVVDDVYAKDDRAFVGSYRTYIYDVEPPEDTYLLQELETGDSTEGLHGEGDYICVVSRDYGDINGQCNIVSIVSPGNEYIEKSVPIINYPEDVHVSDGYAYVADEQAGLEIIDIDPPASAEVVNPIRTIGQAESIRILGNYAYITNDLGFQIIDISSIQNAHVVASIEMKSAVDLDVENGYAYVVEHSYTTGVNIIDIDPVESAHIVNTVMPPEPANAVDVSGDYAYIADGYGDCLLIADINPPESADIVFEVDTPDAALDVTYADGFAYVSMRNEGLSIIDVDPVNTANLVKNVPLSANAAWSTDISGSYAYIATTEGLSIVDILPPQDAFVVNTIDTGNIRDVKVSGSYAYVTDPDDLQVIYLDPPEDAFIVKTISNASSLSLDILDNHVYFACGGSGMRIFQLY